jgi:hypothetical protein
MNGSTSEQLNPEPFTTGDSLHPDRWRAQWIWGSGEPAPENTYVYFRKSFHRDRGPDNVVCHVGGDTNYLLFINGHRVGRGPVHCDPRWQSFDTYDVIEHLQVGENVIGLIGYHYGSREELETGRMAAHPSQGGIFLQLEMEDGTGSEPVVTDRSWSTHLAESWNPSPKYDDLTFAEFYDARREPTGWLEGGFDDSGWTKAKPLTGIKGSVSTRGMMFPWVQMEPRDIPFLEETEIRAASILEIGEVQEYGGAASSVVAARMDKEVIVPSAETKVEGAESLLAADGTATVQPFDYGKSYEDFNGVYDAVVVLDLGEIVNAHFEIEVEGDPGAVIDVGYADRLNNGKVSPFYASLTRQHEQADQYILKEGRQSWRTFDWRHFQYVQLTFRNVRAPLRIHDVKFTRIEYPTEDKGSFSCSDPLLNWAWEAGKKTSKLCMTDRIMDAPNRERRQHITDVTTVLPVNFAAFGDLDIHHRYLRVISQSQSEYGPIHNANPGQGPEATPMLDAAFPFFERIWQHYLCFGDKDLLNELFPRLHRHVEWLRRYARKDGLLGEMPIAVFFDQSDIDRGGTNLCVNAFYARALDRVGRMAMVVGQEDVAATYREKHEAIKPTLSSLFWDDHRGVFVDSLRDGRQSTHVSEHANMLMIGFEYADPEQVPRALRYLEEHESSLEVGQIEALFFIWAGEALFGIGRTQRALDMIRTRYGRMHRAGLQTTGEMWSLHGSRDTGEWRSRSRRCAAHSGATSPTYLLSRFVLGVSPLTPGFGKAEIAPQAGDLEWARGCWPAPQGDIRVEWRFEDGTFVLECVLPSGVEGEVVMPPEVTDFGESVDVVIGGKTCEAPVEERIPVRGTSTLKVKGKKS